MLPDQVLDFVDGQARVNDHEAVRARFGQPQVTGANLLVKDRRLLFHAVGGLAGGLLAVPCPA